MLVLGIETSSPVGSVALLEDGCPLLQATHDTPNAHGEHLLSLVDQLFETTGRRRQDLQLVAVGRGPGAFTGLRIGLSMAQGMAVGLGIPAVGVGSLHAMAQGYSAAGPDIERLAHVKSLPRLSVADARRGELFVACHEPDGAVLWGPSAWPRHGLTALIEGELAPILSAKGPSSKARCLVLGAVLGQLLPEELDGRTLGELGALIYRSPATDYPGAMAVCQIAAEGRYVAQPTPEYLRDADAIVPNLPPNPINEPRAKV